MGGWFKMPTKEQESYDRYNAMLVTYGDSREITRQEFYNDEIIYEGSTEYPHYSLFEQESEPSNFTISEFSNIVNFVKKELGIFESGYTYSREIISLFKPYTDSYIEFRWRENKAIIETSAKTKTIKNLSKVSKNKLLNKILEVWELT